MNILSLNLIFNSLFFASFFTSASAAFFRNLLGPKTLPQPVQNQVTSPITNAASPPVINGQTQDSAAMAIQQPQVDTSKPFYFERLTACAETSSKETFKAAVAQYAKDYIESKEAKQEPLTKLNVLLHCPKINAIIHEMDYDGRETMVNSLKPSGNERIPEGLKQAFEVKLKELPLDIHQKYLDQVRSSCKKGVKDMTSLLSDRAPGVYREVCKNDNCTLTDLDTLKNSLINPSSYYLELCRHYSMKEKVEAMFNYIKARNGMLNPTPATITLNELVKQIEKILNSDTFYLKYIHNVDSVDFAYSHYKDIRESFEHILKCINEWNKKNIGTRNLNQNPTIPGQLIQSSVSHQQQPQANQSQMNNPQLQAQPQQQQLSTGQSNAQGAPSPHVPMQQAQAPPVSTPIQGQMNSGNQSIGSSPISSMQQQQQNQQLLQQHPINSNNTNGNNV